jgi:hypothetical protein
LAFYFDVAMLLSIYNLKNSFFHTKNEDKKAEKLDKIKAHNPFIFGIFAEI